MFKFQWLATLTANLTKPVAGFNSNRVGYLPHFNTKYLPLFLLALICMVLPSEALAQETIDGTGEMFTKFKDFINNMVIPALRILANVAILGLFVATIFFAAARDPRWKFTLGTCFFVAILWYAGPSILNEIREGFDGTYEIQ